MLEAGARVNDPTVDGLPLIYHVMGASESRSEAKMYPKALLAKGAGTAMIDIDCDNAVLGIPPGLEP